MWWIFLFIYCIPHYFLINQDETSGKWGPHNFDHFHVFFKAKLIIRAWVSFFSTTSWRVHKSFCCQDEKSCFGWMFRSLLCSCDMLRVLQWWKLYSFPHSGDTIYARVMVDPVQNLGDSFICNIEKVFLCTGADGYVPKYNPSNFEFGCLADAPSLLYRFKIIVSNRSMCLKMFHVLCVCSNLNIPSSHPRTRPSQRPRPAHLEMWPSKPSWQWMTQALYL